MIFFKSNSEVTIPMNELPDFLTLMVVVCVSLSEIFG